MQDSFHSNRQLKSDISRYTNSSFYSEDYKEGEESEFVARFFQDEICECCSRFLTNSIYTIIPMEKLDEETKDQLIGKFLMEQKELENQNKLQTTFFFALANLELTTLVKTLSENNLGPIGEVYSNSYLEQFERKVVDAGELVMIETKSRVHDEDDLKILAHLLQSRIQEYWSIDKKKRSQISQRIQSIQTKKNNSVTFSEYYDKKSITLIIFCNESDDLDYAHHLNFTKIQIDDRVYLIKLQVYSIRKEPIIDYFFTKYKITQKSLTDKQIAYYDIQRLSKNRILINKQISKLLKKQKQKKSFSLVSFLKVSGVLICLSSITFYTYLHRKPILNQIQAIQQGDENSLVKQTLAKGKQWYNQLRLKLKR